MPGAPTPIILTEKLHQRQSGNTFVTLRSRSLMRDQAP